MRVNGNLTEVRARDLRPGDLIIRGGASGGVTARWVLGQPSIRHGYVVVEVAAERAGRPVGHWQLRADLEHVPVIR